MHVRDTQSHSGRLVFWLPTSAHVTIEDVRNILNQTEASVRNPLWCVTPLQQMILQYTMTNYTAVHYHSLIYDARCAILKCYLFSPLLTLPWLFWLLYYFLSNHLSPFYNLHHMFIFSPPCFSALHFILSIILLPFYSIPHTGYIVTSVWDFGSSIFESYSRRDEQLFVAMAVCLRQDIVQIFRIK